MTLKKLVVGNWKMNGTKADLPDIAAISDIAAHSKADVAICLPATLIESASAFAPHIAIGAQDCHANPNGAHTGCLSAQMIAECGAKYVITGHSERRQDQGESNADVKAKTQAVITADMHAILCVGESEAQRDSGEAVDIVVTQLLDSLPDMISKDGVIASISVAYEPIWAIGTGRIPSLNDVAEMHLALREALIGRYGDIGKQINILYGGSMNGANASDLMAIPHVDGGLVGGASLSAEKFGPVIAAG